MRGESISGKISKCEKDLTVIFGKDTGKMQVLPLDVQALRWGAELLAPAMCPLTSYTLTLCFQVRGGVSSAKNELIYDGFLKSWTKQSEFILEEASLKGLMRVVLDRYQWFHLHCKRVFKSILQWLHLVCSIEVFSIITTCDNPNAGYTMSVQRMTSFSLRNRFKHSGVSYKVWITELTAGMCCKAWVLVPGARSIKDSMLCAVSGSAFLDKQHGMQKQLHGL